MSGQLQEAGSKTSKKEWTCIIWGSFIGINLLITIILKCCCSKGRKSSTNDDDAYTAAPVADSQPINFGAQQEQKLQAEQMQMQAPGYAQQPQGFNPMGQQFNMVNMAPQYAQQPNGMAPMMPPQQPWDAPPMGQQQQFAMAPPMGQQQQFAMGQQQQFAMAPPMGQQQQFAMAPPMGQPQFGNAPMAPQQQFGAAPMGQQPQFGMGPPQGYGGGVPQNVMQTPVEKYNALKDLPSCNPLKLQGALDCAVYTADMMNNRDRATQIATKAMSDAVDGIDDIDDDDQFKIVQGIIEQLKNKISEWQ